MKIIISEDYKNIQKLKIFNRKNYKNILNSLKKLPHKHYEMELFETKDKENFIISFNNDLHIKIKNEDREEFEKCAGFKIGDHININIGKI